jgi:uncharacterized membrane protein SpoIIM required for sporulation
MLEMIINPKKAERKPWELFFVGLFYASLSFLMVNYTFGKDPVLSKYLGVLLVSFTVMFSMPFIYYTMKLEEKKIVPKRGTFALLKEHEKAIFAFLWLFLGFVVAYSFWYIVLSSNASFQAQIETYCSINQRSNFERCVEMYTKGGAVATTGAATSNGDRFISIFTNNMYVLIFTLIFSLVLGAGVIFVLAWNASVISAAIGIFTKSELTALPLGILRYIIHGLPEIASYFIVALAGGLVSIAVIKHEVGTEKFWEVLQDSLNLIIVAIVVLFIAAVLEVYVTPNFF